MEDKIHFEVYLIGVLAEDTEDDNIDVEVSFADGSRYGATFFTLKNLATLFTKNRQTGECRDGSYLWASNMIIAEKLSMETIKTTIHGLLNDNEFESAFSKLS